MSEPLNAATVSIVQDVAQVGRRMRSPKHPFQLRHRPYQIQPFMIAPVLPGDTLERLDLKVNCVTSGVKNPLLGWWMEHQYYFVPLTALENPETEAVDVSTGVGIFRSLMLDPAADLSAGTYWYDGSTGGAELEFMVPANHYGYNFLSAALDVIVKNYFRDEDEVSGGSVAPTLGALPLARIKPPGQEDYAESLLADSAVVVPDILDPGAGEVASTDPLFNAFTTMQQVGAVGSEVTYDDWLRDQGIRVPKASRFSTPIPELIRSTRSYKKPSNTPDATGALSSVVVWDITEDATKKRFFNEPGFIVGVTFCRPKVYLSRHNAPAVNTLMDRAYSWMPKALSERPELALRKFTQTTGPLDKTVAWGDYWIDVVDLFVHGDQFLNFAMTETDAGLVALPVAGMTKTLNQYPTGTMIDAMFSGATKLVYQDGITQLRVLSRLRDLT